MVQGYHPPIGSIIADHGGGGEGSKCHECASPALTGVRELHDKIARPNAAAKRDAAGNAEMAGRISNMRPQSRRWQVPWQR